jgi:hypothetical protein
MIQRCLRLMGVLASIIFVICCGSSTSPPTTGTFHAVNQSLAVILTYTITDKATNQPIATDVVVLPGTAACTGFPLADGARYQGVARFISTGQDFPLGPSDMTAPGTRWEQVVTDTLITGVRVAGQSCQP